MTCLAAACLLISCASTQFRLEERGAIFIETHTKDSYHFSLLLARQLERQGTEVAASPATADTLLTLDKLYCNRHVLFTDELGRRSDYLVQCRLDYSIKTTAADSSASTGSVTAQSVLNRSDKLSVYFQREEELNNFIRRSLARQLLLDLALFD